MAESPDLDFRTEYSPAIPEVQCPSTPGPQLSIKSPELSTTTSSDESEVAEGDGTQSPPPNCAICLGRCRNKCFTNSCMHQFCFKCLLEWSKVKPECPLCKQTFKAIIHNVKSIDQFEEYLVQQPVPTSPSVEVLSPFSLPAHLYPRLPPLYNGRVHLYMNDFSMNTLDLTGTASSNRSIPNLIQEPPRAGYVDRRLVPAPAQLLDMYSQESIQGETGSGSLSQLWRRYVYDRKLFALPLPDITGRLRESSARFYRDNPSQIHRLMPWINRDIVCLLRNTEHDVSAVMEQINTMLTTCNILSPDFRRRLHPFLGTKTVHFIHELNNFARSPFDMNGYDRVVQYSANNTEDIVIEFTSTSSAGSDVESVNNDVQQEASTSRRASQQHNLANANSGGGFNLYTTTSTSTSSQSSAINLSTHNRGATGEVNEGSTTSTVQIISAPVAERPTNIVLSSTSSDECEFVMEQKPPHLRTPELVSLNSDTDSDVVFVQETKTTPLTSGIAKWASTYNARVRRTQRKRANPSLNVCSFSTSNSDTDDYHYPGDVSTPKKVKMDLREENAAADACATCTSESKPTSEPVTKVKEEFNQGASTSTGVQSRYRGSRPVGVERRYRQSSDTSDSDEVEDSDSSSSDSYLTTEGYNSPSDSDTSWSKSRRNSNKQSLKRSRQQRPNSSRKSRRQISTSAKSKRTKRAKDTSNKSSSSGRKKKTNKRSRRKSLRSKTSHRKRRSTPVKDESTSEDESSSWTCNTSPGSTVQHPSGDDVSHGTPQPEQRSLTSSPASNSTSDNNEVPDDARSRAPLSVGEPEPPSPKSPTTELALPPSQETDVNPDANMAIYSDTD